MPYCTNEMKKGYLQGNGSTIVWDIKKHRMMVNSSKFMFPRESSISAKVCLDCGKLFDFKADEVENLNK